MAPSEPWPTDQACRSGLWVLWNACYGEGQPEVSRQRPWYRREGILTMASMPGKLRLAIWSE